MTNSRSSLVKEDEVGVYNCVSRCVRRAFLCGIDNLSGQCFEHRRTWIKSRLKFLESAFAVDLVTYAVLSNHLHTLLRIRPDIAASWSPEEVARRWRTLFPIRRENGLPAEPNAKEIEAITAHPDLVLTYRKRLASLSWFNRCLNERIARMANAEDDCTGRFWEGRFKCQKVESISAILACSVYVDLNPIRAGIARTPEESNFTGIQDRIFALKNGEPRSTDPVLSSIEEITDGALSTQDYLELVDATGRELVAGKAAISDAIAPILQRLNLNPGHWNEYSQAITSKFNRVVAPVDTLRSIATSLGQSWLKGINSARALFI
jgi:REP element-mobilizing transposase RayT